MSEDFPAQLAGFRPGSLLAGYRLEAPIGAGGMAVVFRARDERLGRLVALKILTPALAADGAFRRRFIAESRAAAAVDDPHIIPVYEAGEAGGVLFIAMRFVMGGDLRGVLEREGALAPGRAAAFISPVASALDAAHRAGLVHRDVKPANILVDAREDRPDHVYLSDFGVSKGAISSVSVTGAGHFVGTPDYSAPEQIGGLPVDGRADQYALACVAYQLLTGSTPFEREQGMAVLYAHLSAPPPSLSERRPDLPRAAGQVLNRALSKAPEHRYGSCREFSDAFREALHLPPYIAFGSAPAPAVPAVPADVATVDSAPGGGPEPVRLPRHRVAGRPGARTTRTRRRRLPLLAATGAVLAAAAIVPFVLPGSPGHQSGGTGGQGAGVSGQRGSIITADGVTIAESTPVNDAYKYQRKYPHGVEYAPVTGYDTLYSQTGIEYYENSALKDGSVTLTINSRAQDAAWNALRSGTGGKPGAAVALNPQTGAILAMASYPSYDPDVLATHNATKLNAADKALLDQASEPLLNRAIDFASPPGATFNIVTSSVYLTQTRNSTPQTSIDAPTQLSLPQTTHVLTNRNGEACGNGSGQASLLTAFAQSCDTAFGGLGLSLGGQALSNFAELFGLNSTTLRIPMPVTQSSYVIPPSGALTAFSAIGQYSDTVTPLQEAMFAAAIADRGTLMRPYLVKQVATASGSGTVQTTEPAVLSQPVSTAVARAVGQLMLAAVQDPDGTANAFNTATVGVTVACATGTAQNGVNNTGLNDAVITCYAPYDNPQIAVGVIIQGGGYAVAAAAPIAVQTIRAYLASRR